jgi:hypothetical protein
MLYNFATLFLLIFHRNSHIFPNSFPYVFVLQLQFYIFLPQFIEVIYKNSCPPLFKCPGFPPSFDTKTYKLNKCRSHKSNLFFRLIFSFQLCHTCLTCTVFLYDVCLKCSSLHKHISEKLTERYVSLHLKHQLFLFDFNQNWNSSTQVSETSECHIY